MRDITIFIEGLRELDIDLTENQIKQFMTYYDMLIEKNNVMNLTAITEFEEVIKKHFIDSLSLIRVKNLDDTISIVDIGTGAGFPGIPLKIAFPKLKIILLDSLNKRVNFLNEVIQMLNLKEIKTIHGRAEDYGRDAEYREKFDLCVSRAVANLATLSEYCMPFVKVDGDFVSYKSGKIEEELNDSKKAVKALGGNLTCADSFFLPDTDIERTLVVIHKMKTTSKVYPRSAGRPSKEPIR